MSKTITIKSIHIEFIQPDFAFIVKRSFKYNKGRLINFVKVLS